MITSKQRWVIGHMRRGRWGVKSFAFHEAGHAVMFFLVTDGGEGLECVKISPDEGQCKTSPEVRGRLCPEAQVMICWAGAAAQTIRARQKLCIETPFLSWDDRNALLRLEPIHHVDIEPLRQKTRSMLKEAKTWAAVEEVAAALLEKACLTGDEVNRIIGRVVGRGLVPGPMLEIKGGEGE